MKCSMVEVTIMVIKDYATNELGVEVEIHLKDKLTLVGGDSGVGKTFIYNLLLNRCKINEFKCEYLFIDRSFTADRIRYLIDGCCDNLIVIDNTEIILDREIKRNISRDKRNQYIIFTHSIAGFWGITKKNLAYTICNGNKIKIYN